MSIKNFTFTAVILGLFIGFQNCSQTVDFSSRQAGQKSSEQVPVDFENVIDFSLSESNLNFGKIEVSQKSLRQFKILNKSTINIKLSEIKIESSTNQKSIDFTMSSSCQNTIEVSKSCEVNVEFKPNQVGLFNHKLTVFIESLPEKSVGLLGESVAVVPIVKPECRSFGVLTAPPSQENLCNSGAVQNFSMNDVTFKYNWSCRGTNETINCQASFEPKRFCDYRSQREGINYLSTEGDIYKFNIDGSRTLVKSCPSNSRGPAALPNGGMNCADFNVEATCCSEVGKVSMNGKCISPQPLGGACFADPGCQGGLSCIEGMCRTSFN